MAERDKTGNIWIGTLRIDIGRRTIERAGRPLDVEGRVFDLLVHLALNRGRVSTKSDLLDAVWGDRVVSESTLYRAIRLARSALEDQTEHRIRTVHSRGYELIGPVVISRTDRADEKATSNPGDTAGTEPDPGPGMAGTRRYLAFAAAAAAVLALVALALRPDTNGASGAPDEELLLTIAELEVPAADAGFPAAGLWAELESDLARIDRLRLRRNSGDQRPGEGRMLRGVWSQRSDDSLQLHVELLDSASDRLVWSANFERGIEDTDQLRRDVTHALIDALGLAPINDAGEPLPLPAGMASSTYSEYLRARELWRERSTNSLQLARNLLESVVLERPDFARAHEALASVYLVLPDWADVPVAETRSLALSAGREALRLEPRLGEARAVLAQLALYRRHWTEAKMLFEDALKREGGNPTIRHWYAEFLLRTGQLQLASAQAAEAVAQDPLAAMPANVTAWAALLGGQNVAAENYAARAMAAGLESAGLIRAWAAARRGDAQAGRWLQSLPQPTGYLPQCADAIDGRTGGAGLMQSIRLSDRDDELARIYALACTAMTQRAVLDLPTRIPPADSSAFGLLWADEFAAFRRSPEFLERLESSGLIDYWLRSGPPDGCTIQDRSLDCVEPPLSDFEPVLEQDIERSTGNDVAYADLRLAGDI